MLLIASFNIRNICPGEKPIISTFIFEDTTFAKRGQRK
jgi:hypothetical protein